ncbi:hypothetical protein OP10G_1234 [Fimbriimonas ginsengisoli Gsoil 348]|uniref:Uncharacterized protein n=1 Tax=Fimbriimonas ginsengisoli Gsoil 348 TaxID=661478 RepID=A0A068NMJ8_FIMGI|nr:hypothetical protein OP10G_1234 [Fimbriimonas ginsengisoli Gsoil 348]
MWDGRIADDTGASVTHDPGVSSVIYTHTPSLVDGIANRLRW